jgi:hypothetical protein
MTFRILFVIAVLFSAGCGRDYTYELQEENIIKLIDQRKYGEVVDILEPHAATKLNLVPYLAEAHLGLAHFEPINMAGPILSGQGVMNPALDKIFPRCFNVRLQKFDQISVPCMVKRLIQTLPSSQDPNFARARHLLRNYYPNPMYVEHKYNLLIGAVELGSAISRLGELAVYYKSLNADSLDKSQVKTLLVMAEETVNYAAQAMYRARYSGKSITQLLTGIKTVEFLYATGNDFQLDAGTGIPSLNILSDSKNKSLETDVLRVLVVQNIDRMIEKLGQ